MATLDDIPVPFTILRDPPPTIQGGPGGRGGDMHFCMALNDRGAFIQTMAGTTETIPIPGGGTSERIIPLVHPDDPGLFAVSYDSKAIGGAGNVWGEGLSVYTEMFTHAVISVRFESLPFALGSADPWYTLNVTSGVTIETIPDGAFLFDGVEEMTGEAGIPIPLVQYNLTTYLNTQQISYAVAQLSGKVNSVEFEGFPAGFIRYTGTVSEMTRGGSGTSLVKSYALSFRPIMWNYSMRRNGVWAIPLTAGGLTKYQTADLNILKYY